MSRARALVLLLHLISFSFLVFFFFFFRLCNSAAHLFSLSIPLSQRSIDLRDRLGLQILRGLRELPPDPAAAPDPSAASAASCPAGPSRPVPSPEADRRRVPRVIAPPHAHPHQRDPCDRSRVGRGPQRDRPEDQGLGREKGRGGAEGEERRGVDRPDSGVARADQAEGAGGEGPDRKKATREVVDEVRGAVEEVGLELLREEEAEVDCFSLGGSSRSNEKRR